METASVRAALEASYRLDAFEDIDSTNEEARRRVESGTAQPALLWASMQTAGRGRMGRDWHSPTGNIFATFLEPVSGDIGQIALRSFAVAAAIADATDKLIGHPAAQLKWPNDVLIDGAKLSGILLELATAPNSQLWLITGFGVNVETAPAGTPYPATSLAQHAPGLKMDAALAEIVRSYQAHIAALNIHGFAPLREQWLKRAYKLGQEIAVRDGKGGQAVGLFQGLGMDGTLHLDTASTLRHISAGDVYFPDMAAR